MEALSHALVVAVTQQAVILTLAALILDGGHILRICVLAAVASWLCTLLIMLRRPKQPTTVDLAIIKYGFWPAIPIVLTVGSIVLTVGSLVEFLTR